MTDVSNFRVNLTAPTPELAALIKAHIDEHTSGSYFHEEGEGCSLDLGAHDVIVGTVDALHTWLTELVQSGVPDFPWQINDEPAYEFLGAIVYHTPGLPDFSGMCDADGTIILHTGWLLKTIEDATDLDHLKAQVRTESALAHRAYRGWTG